MTKQEEFIWNNIFRQSMKGGASERRAKDCATDGLEQYRRRGIGKEGALKFIEHYVKQAKKIK